MSVVTAQRAHDELLEQMPEGVSHRCALCESGAGTTQKAKEVAEVAEPERTFSETEHFALLTDAVTRETAGLQTAKEELEKQLTELQTEKSSEVNDLQGRLDILEAEKSAAEKARTELAEEFEAFKTGLNELAEIETRKAERSAAVKEAAGDLLDDDYVTDVRVQRWAEMSDEAFEAVLADFRDLAAKNPFAKNADDKKKKDDDDPEKAARTTAAFSAGESPSAAGEGSLFNQFLTATGKLPVASS